MRRRSFHIDDATWYALRARAAADNTTIAAIIRDLITTHLTAQEPSDAEVGAVQKCLYERTLTWVPTVEVRAALSAARATRRDEEKQDG